MKGLYGKYYIEKANGDPVSGFKFILSPENDNAALEALKTYAKTTTNQQLANELNLWIAQHDN